MENTALVQGAAVRSLWRLGLRWRVRLFQRHRFNRLVMEEVAGLPLLVLPGVFNPKLFRTGEFLARVLDQRLIPSGSTVLDLGTGTGVGALCAARFARRVVAVDINPAAVRCTRINVLLHQREGRVEVRQGDLFAPVEGERFEAVLFNPPYFRGEPRDGLDQAWRATDVVERFASGLGNHLSPGGQALVVLSSDGERDAFLGAFRANGFSVEVAARRDLINEVLCVYLLREEPETPRHQGTKQH